MEDLSHILPGGPFTVAQPTSQAAGNSQSSNELAMTASGSPPTDPEIARENMSDPAITPTDLNGRAELDATGAKVTADLADRSTPFNRADGSPWLSGSDAADPVPEMNRRSMLRRGGGWANRNEF